MRLLIDIGNSRFKWRSDNGTHVGAVEYAQHALADYLDKHWNSLTEVSSCWACSVADEQLNQKLSEWCLNNWGISVNWVKSSVSQLGVNNLYDSPEQLGADRWIALIAAKALMPVTPICVVDAGTAITVDALSEQGDFLGGVIIPGKALMQDALGHNTAQIPAELAVETALDVQARNTYQAVLTGVELTLNAGVTRIIQEHLTEYQRNMKIILTGGGAAGINLPYAGVIEQPNLVFDGLNLIAKSSE